MKPLDLVLDTHVLMWLLHDDPRCPAAVHAAIGDRDSTVTISVASWTELAIKTSLGKLDFPIADARQLFRDHDYLELPIRYEHAIELASLPLHHRDPFDRILIAQARVEELTLVTADRALASYDVPIIGLD